MEYETYKKLNNQQKEEINYYFNEIDELLDYGFKFFYYFGIFSIIAFLITIITEEKTLLKLDILILLIGFGLFIYYYILSLKYQYKIVKFYKKNKIGWWGE